MKEKEKLKVQTPHRSAADAGTTIRFIYFQFTEMKVFERVNT